MCWGGVWFIVGYLSKFDTFRLLGSASDDSNAGTFDIGDVLEPSFVVLAHRVGPKIQFHFWIRSHLPGVNSAIEAVCNPRKRCRRLVGCF